MNKFEVTIVGAGLAGTEAALVLARYPQISIKLIEMRPKTQTEVHKTGDAAELVCSNSFKSIKFNSASGMLKYELASLASPLLDLILKNRVSAGNALAVDRITFAKNASDAIKKFNNIQLVCEEFSDINKELKRANAVILATGPLTSDSLSKRISEITGECELAFFDAAAPIVMSDSLDKDKIFAQNRYDSDDGGDYLNAPFTKKEYENFINNLIDADCVIKKDFESRDLFGACQPIEEVARSGFDAPRHGAMKPVGIKDSRTEQRPWAVVQLRPENKEKTSYNLVGFQSNLTFSEQKRVFRMIPGLENAEFARFGVMHRNTFINSPKLLDNNLQLKKNLYVAGQLCGTEGYLEAVRSGHHAALCICADMLNTKIPELSTNTVFGALLDYATFIETKNYQPMHVNFGLLPSLDKKIRNKQERYNAYSVRAKIAFDNYVNDLLKLNIIDAITYEQAQKLKLKLNNLWVSI